MGASSISPPFTKGLSRAVFKSSTPIALVLSMCSLNLNENTHSMYADWLQGAAVTSLTSDIFQYNTKLRYIDVSDNQFTSIPIGLFNGLDSLSDVHMYNIDWQCSCDNMWFVEHAVNNNITLFGEYMCADQPGICHDLICSYIP